MKFEWPSVLEEFWDRLAMKIRVYGVKFLVGDFSMASCRSSLGSAVAESRSIAALGTPGGTKRRTYTNKTWASIPA